MRADLGRSTATSFKKYAVEKRLSQICRYVNFDDKVVLDVGRNGIYALRALPKLETDVIPEIVGKGPYRKSLVKLARKLSAPHQVYFSTFSNNMRDLQTLTSSLCSSKVRKSVACHLTNVAKCYWPF